MASIPRIPVRQTTEAVQRVLVQIAPRTAASTTSSTATRATWRDALHCFRRRSQCNSAQARVLGSRSSRGLGSFRTRTLDRPEPPIFLGPTCSTAEKQSPYAAYVLKPPHWWSPPLLPSDLEPLLRCALAAVIEANLCISTPPRVPYHTFLFQNYRNPAFIGPRITLWSWIASEKGR